MDAQPGVAPPPGVAVAGAPGMPTPAQQQAAWAAYNAQQAMMMQVRPWPNTVATTRVMASLSI
eukprot:COSAG05_NODE_5791_length_1086_cov_103.772036_1_plen_63_part_00